VSWLDNSSAGTHYAKTRCRSARPGRTGFTLVELLVVILIIAMLAAILTPVVMRAQSAARNAAIKSEIDMLHMAIMNYKNDYGGFPPGFDNALTISSDATKHLNRLFPRCVSSTASAQLTTALSTATPSFITGTNAITFWLSGYTDNPTSPLLPLASRKRLFNFDMSRVNASTGAYFPSGKSESPYLYVNSSLYSSAAYAGGAAPGALRQTYAGDPTPFYNVGSETNEFFNTDTFQILCAGRDETFGTDDDLSNFWPGTRRDYLDSLKQ